MELPKRKVTRLKEWDYSTPGAYFLTICTAEKRCILSRIPIVGEGLAPPAVELSEIGKIVEEQILDLPRRFPSVSLDKYVIMPNHVHLLISLTGGEASGGASPSPTAVDVVRAMKSISARQCRARFGIYPLWQRSFHDHVIRGEKDYLEIWQYIDNNPARWAEDCYAPEEAISKTIQSGVL